jgi:hypothetical protein
MAVNQEHETYGHFAAANTVVNCSQTDLASASIVNFPTVRSISTDILTMDHTKLYATIHFPHDMSSLKLEQRSGQSFSMPALKQQTQYMEFTDASGWMDAAHSKSSNTGMEFPGSTLPSKYTIPFVHMSQQGSQWLSDIVPPEIVKANATVADPRSANLSYASHGQAGAGRAMGDLAYQHPQADIKQAPMPPATQLSAQDLPDDVISLISYINAANAKNGAPINDGSSSFTSSPDHDAFGSCGFDSGACGDNRTLLPSFEDCTFTPSTEQSRFAASIAPQQVQMQASNGAGMGATTALASALSGLGAQNDSFVPYMQTPGLTTSAADLAQAMGFVDAQGSQEVSRPGDMQSSRFLVCVLTWFHLLSVLLV